MNNVPVKNEKIEFKYLDDETFILSLKKEKFYKLNNVGTDIWKLVDGKRAVEDIIAILSKKYDVKETDLRKDIVAFINNGVKHDLIEHRK